MPRVSAFGAGAGVAFQPFAMRKSVGGEVEPPHNIASGLSEKEIDDRVSVYPVIGIRNRMNMSRFADLKGSRSRGSAAPRREGT